MVDGLVAWKDNLLAVERVVAMVDDLALPRVVLRADWWVDLMVVLRVCRKVE